MGCRRVQTKAWRKANPEKVSRIGKNKHVRDPLAQMLTAAKHRAKRDNIPFSITCDDLQIPETCPILGISLVVAKGRMTAASPSLDRIIPELGYVAGNVRVISHRGNTIKNDGTAREHLLVARYIQESTGAPSDER